MDVWFMDLLPPNPNPRNLGELAGVYDRGEGEVRWVIINLSQQTLVPGHRTEPTAQHMATALLMPGTISIIWPQPYISSVA